MGSGITVEGETGKRRGIFLVCRAGAARKTVKTVKNEQLRLWQMFSNLNEGNAYE